MALAGTGCVRPGVESAVRSSPFSCPCLCCRRYRSESEESIFEAWVLPAAQAVREANPCAGMAGHTGKVWMSVHSRRRLMTSAGTILR
jgi:hypothetical protein